MQPPPARKGPYVKTLKHVHSEQLARLQAKNQHECDLLEDIKNFTKQRSQIEKTYAEALLKISSAYLNKKIPSIPDLRDEDENERWNVWNVWRTVLEENEKLARARLAAMEVFQQQITEDAKTIRHAKLQASKKCLEQLFVVQKEVQSSVQDLDRNKKLYFEEEHLAHDARVRASDAEEKLKKKKGSIFSSFTSLQRSSVKFSSKKEALEEKSTGARNEYILALAGANAHQDHYFNYDMEKCLRTLEGDVYDKLKEYLTIIGRTELLTCSAAQNSFTKIRDQAQMLSRDYNVMCCVQYYPVLKQDIRYPFDSCEGDNCRKLTEEHGSSQTLTGEAKKWAQHIAKQCRIIRESQRKLPVLQTLRDSGHRNDPDDPDGPDINVKIDDVRENIRRAHTEKFKAEACIECLRDGGIDVDVYLSEIEDYTKTSLEPPKPSPNIKKAEPEPEPQQKQKAFQQEHEQESFYDSDSHETSISDKMKVPESRNLDSAEPDEDDIEIHVEFEKTPRKIEPLAQTWDDPINVDWGDTSEPPTIISPPISGGQVGHTESWQDPGAAEVGIVKCVAIYSYTSQNPDELTILENEHLDLIGEGDGDGWVRARNYKGEEGYVPQNYVEVETNTSPAGYPLQPQISFSSVDYHVQETNTAAAAATGGGQEDHTSISNGYPEQAETEDYLNQNLPEEIPITTAPTTVSSGLTTPFINDFKGEDGMFCRALYDYEATAPEELSFYGDQIIRILNMTPHNEDDGWWEGEYDGLRGLFPSIVTEECRWDGEPLSPVGMDDDDDEEESESGINPPAYTPPEINPGLFPPEKVVVIEPTPEIEVATTAPAAASGTKSKPTTYAYDKPNFELELTNDQQQKYQGQFGGENAEGVDIVISEVPDVTVTVPEGEASEFEDKSASEVGEGDAGLEVTQIVITAATPMSEEHKSFPADSAGKSKGKTPEPPAEKEEVPEEVEFEAFADFSQLDEGQTEGDTSSGFDDSAFPPDETDETLDPEEVTDVKLVKVGEGEMEAQIEELKSVLEPKKASLEIDDESKRLTHSESGESPVTPEELDMQNLAKLESLKESDA